MATQTPQKPVPPVVASKPTPDKTASKPIVENDSPKPKVDKDKSNVSKEQRNESADKSGSRKGVVIQNLAGVAFGPKGELYVFDDDRGAVKRYKWEKNSIKGPDTFKLARKDQNDNVKSGPKPQDVAYLKSDEFNGLVITMDNGNMHTMSGKDLSKKNMLNMTAKFSDISDLRAAKEDKSLLNTIRKKFPLLAVNTANSSVDLLNTEGMVDSKLTVDPSVGVVNARFTHAEDRDLVIVTGNGGLYCLALSKGEGDNLELKISANIPSDDTFQPRGVCVAGNNIYVCNPAANRLVKLDIEKDGDVLVMNTEMKIHFDDPQSVDVYSDDKMSNLCVVNAHGEMDIMTLWKD